MTNNINNQMRCLEQVFSALSNLFSFPNSELFQNDVFTDTNQSAFDSFNIDIGGKFKDLKEIFKNNSNDNLMVEYARLFVGPYKLIAPPYGSFYLDNGRLMGDSTVEVIKLFDMAGLSITSTFKDLPDHIIAELEFLYFLFYNRASLIEKEELIQIQMLDTLISNFYYKYFKSWIPTFSQLILENSSLKFYKNIGELLNLVCLELEQILNSFSRNN